MVSGVCRDMKEVMPIIPATREDEAGGFQIQFRFAN